MPLASTPDCAAAAGAERLAAAQHRGGTNDDVRPVNHRQRSPAPVDCRRLTVGGGVEAEMNQQGLAVETAGCH
jgi:hypothetical protein